MGEMKSMMTYVLLLRGINVGGKMLSMQTLREMLTSMGYVNVRTLLNSGNAIFDAEEINPQELVVDIEQAIVKTFGFSVDVLVRSMQDIQIFVQSDPFRGVNVTPDTRLYVTFLSSPPWIHTTVLNLSDKTKTTDMMKDLEKRFGKKITTRNWNTVLKLVR
jgi:uncharacterized protein (DUF1697 family)